MKLFRFLLPLSLAATVAAQTPTEILPGFRIDSVAEVPGFVSSVVTDSKGTIYCTTTDGWIHRIEGNASVPVTALPTRAGGNGGLLGMALIDDETAAVHYTTWDGESDRVLDDVIAEVDLATGAERVLAVFTGDIEWRARGVSDEHHGGNPTVAPDGSIFVGIGEYHAFAIAQDPRWNAGKIWRVHRDGNTQQYARGMRNPYDLAWDPELQRVVVADNGASGGDEMHVVDFGDNCGWPQTYGNNEPYPGAVEPVYVWPNTVAPTGLHRLGGPNRMLPRGYLVGSFVTRALYYFPDLSKRPVNAPVAIVKRFREFIIDVTEGPQGEIYLATAMGGASEIQRLHVPPRGDCNGDGLADMRDLVPVMKEIEDGKGQPRITAQDGAHKGSWGCDANDDSIIDDSDYEATLKLVFTRRRAARS